MADVYVRALYDFEAGNSEELTFQEVSLSFSLNISMHKHFFTAQYF